MVGSLRLWTSEWKFYLTYVRLMVRRTVDMDGSQSDSAKLKLRQEILVLPKLRFGPQRPRGVARKFLTPCL